MRESAEPGLFRAEALLFRRRSGEGRPKLVTPPGSGLLCGMLVVALAAGLAYLKGCDYTRKATVSGYLQTSSMTKRVFPAVTGTVLSLLVKPGQRVRRHQLLATLRTASDLDEKDRRTLLAGYDRQIGEVRQRLLALRNSRRVQDKELGARIASTHLSLHHVRRMIHIQAKKVIQLRKTQRLMQPLFTSGHLSWLEWQRVSGALLDGEEQLERLSGEANDKQDQIRDLKIRLKKLSFDARGQIAELQQEISRIAQSRHSLASRARLTIRADVAGVVANVFVQPGDRVSDSRPLLSITPAGARLVACLLVPSSAVGMLNPGQRVNLLYDAFPYQQFGTFRGAITRLSKHALAPGDSSFSLAGRQPFFEAIARIDRPWVMVHGRRIALRAGMSLNADIFMDRHSLLAWMLDPLSALGASNP